MTSYCGFSANINRQSKPNYAAMPTAYSDNRWSEILIDCKSNKLQ